MLEDIVKPGLRLIICGTAAGTRSSRLKQYYAGRGNKFWRLLADVGLTPRQLAPIEAPFLLDFGIGLTDLVKGQSGSDALIRFDQSDVSLLCDKIAKLEPRYLCFNGKRAAREFFGTRGVVYGLQAERIGVTELFVAPSTSAAGNRFWELSWWRDLAERVKETA